MAKTGGIDLNALRIFAAVAEAGGLTAAGERLGCAKAKVSLELGRLEAQLGVSLFSRTTRRVTMTDAGQTVYAECIPMIRDVEESLVRIAASHTPELTGTLRIAATVDHATQTLARAVAEFARLHPGLQIEIRTSDRVVDLVKEGIDLAIRFGWLRDSTLRALKLGEFEQHVVASAAYLKQAGRPRQPEDLSAHAWIALLLLRTPLTWKFTSAGGQARTVRMNARLKADSSVTLRSLLHNGAGISVLDQVSAEESVRAGLLVRVLPEWSLPRGGVYVVYPPGRNVPAKVRAFIDFYGPFLKRSGH